MTRAAMLVLIIISVVSCSDAIKVEHEAKTTGKDSLTIVTSNESSNTNGTGTTFFVDDVVPTDTTLNTFEMSKVVEHKLQKEVLFISAGSDSNLVLTNGNAFLATVHESYDKHLPLRISPDHVWLTICQAISIHVNMNFDSLKGVLLKHPEAGVQSLVARNDSLSDGATHWGDLINQIAPQIAGHTVDSVYDLLTPKFSTTTPLITTVYNINVMNCFAQNFRYIGESGCGIPSITLTGTPADWEQILSNLEGLDQFGLTEWKQELKPVIKEFVAASQGNVNALFWQEMYKSSRDYAAEYVSGWVIKLFPYLNEVDRDGGVDWKNMDEKDGRVKARLKYKVNPFIAGNAYHKCHLQLSDFPTGISKATIEWKDYLTDKETMMEVSGGFFGMKQDSDYTVEPYVCWSVGELNANKPYHKFDWASPGKAIDHELVAWSPNFAEKPAELGVFMPKTNALAKASYDHLKSVIKQMLDGKVVRQTTIEIEVLFNGEVGDIVFNGVPEIHQTSIEKFIRGTWKPARSPISDVIDMMGDPREKELINVNSKVLLDYKD